MPDVSLIKELFTSCTNNDYSKKRLTFSPDVPEFNSNFLFVVDEQDGQSLEIIVFKSTIKKIFKESHEYFEHVLSRRRDGYSNWTEYVNEIDDSETLDLYYMTLGMMLITNDNHTINQLHWALVEKITSNTSRQFTSLHLEPTQFLIKEVTFIELLLGSNNNKLNKSSTLWHFYKRFFVMNILPKWNFLETALRSGESHPTNYYSWGFIRWLAKYSELAKDDELFNEILSKMRQFCQKHTNDIASWDSLVDILSPGNDALSYVKDEVVRLGGCVESQTCGDIFISIEDYVYGIFEWIDKACVQSTAPYHSLKKLISQHDDELYDVLTKIQSRLESRQDSLKAELGISGISYEIFNESFKTNKYTQDDLIFHEKLVQFINWERVLNYWNDYNTQRKG